MAPVNEKTTFALIIILTIMPIITQVHADAETEFWLNNGEWWPMREGETSPVRSLGSGNALRKARGNFTASETGFYLTLSYTNVSPYERINIDIECPDGIINYAFPIPYNQTNSPTEDISLTLNHHHNESALAYDFYIDVWLGLEYWQATETTTTGTTGTTSSDQLPIVMVISLIGGACGVIALVIVLIVFKKK